MKRWISRAGVLGGLGLVALACAGSRPKFAPPEDAPAFPEGDGWYCFHAFTPHHASVCKRELDKCTKVRASVVASKTALEEYILSPPPEPPKPPSAEPSPAPHQADPDFPEGEYPEDPGASDSSGLSDLCSIDPGACPADPGPRFSIPEYSACDTRPAAFCSAYYHEFNYWKPHEETHWKYFCASKQEDCEHWRGLLHLHLAKQPCKLVR